MKTVIITGASGNMGQAMVRKFLSEGYRVVGTAVHNDPVPMEIDNANFEKIIVDLGNEDDSEKLVNGLIEKYKSIDVVIATVGGFAMGDINATKSADLLKQYKLNFETAYNITRPTFTQMMKQKSGRIFLVGSRPGLEAKEGKGMIAYGLAKSLIFRFVELMNLEAKGTDVSAAVLVPSTIDTPQNRKSMPDKDFDSWVKPEAIADAVYFYCTEGASAIKEPIIKLYNRS